MARKFMIPVLGSIIVLAAVWISFGPEPTGQMTADQLARKISQEKAALKAQMKTEGKLYEPGMFPNDWSFKQRAYPYNTINFKQMENALADAQAMRLAVKGERSRSWVERGPSNIGARVADLEMHPTDPNIIYAAMASGGVFKSTDGGSSWDPIFDDQPVLAIGDMAIDPTNPDVIYVGTGEATAHSFSWFGMGVFKSTDGGATWGYIGLDQTRYIARILIDPFDTDRLWVAATGALFGTNPERGIYFSRDGGDSWDQVLFVSDSTAAIDVAFDPTKPDTLYAAMWERVRGLTYRQSGGVTSGIYRSYDGGDNWIELTSGLPSGSSVGRIGLSVCESSPNVIYAIYADHPGYFAGVYRSTNRGSSWTRTNDGDLSNLYSSFGWYFGQIRVDPSDPDRVFALGVPFYRSENGGSSWSVVGTANHVDHHAMVFDPADPTRIFEGNDGGIYVSGNSGDTWAKLYDQPTNQFYAIEIDHQNPARLYGGTQDNGTLRTATGATDDWENILGGDGFYTIVDPTNSNTIFAEYQYGNLYKSTNFAGSWSYAIGDIPGSDRRNWSTPVVLDPSDPQTMYYGTYRVYQSTNGAGSWSAISGDLTNGDQGAGFGTITTIAVSPSDPDVIYVGTDDSNAWITQNGGGNWTSISSSLPNRWVSRVAVDPYDPDIAYVTFSGLRWDEEVSHVYRTADAGGSWTDIAGNLPDAPVNAILVDPEMSSILYLGSDVGCFYTTDVGTTWDMLGTDLPAVPVYDLKLHQPTRTLVAGTYGRSMHAYDVSPLTALASRDLPAPAVVAELSNHPNPFNPSTTVVFTLKEPSNIDLAVYDIAGRRVRTLETGDRRAGMHRAEWDSRNDHGRVVASGIYFLRLEADGRVVTTKMNLLK